MLSQDQINALLRLQSLHGGTFQIIAWYTSKSRGLEIHLEWYSALKAKKAEKIYQWIESTQTWQGR